MAIRNILFDFDGTLVDTNELIIKSFQHTYQRHLNKQVDREKIIKNYRSFQVRNFEKLITIRSDVKAGIIELHNQRYKLGIVTSRLNDSAMMGLNHFELKDYFESIVGADNTEIHKPDPTPAFMALKELKGKPEETMLVGDSPYDILCAKNAGITSVIVGWSALPMDMLLKYEPDYVVDSMEELVELVRKLR
jgi:pyrophosphatase PpaX